MAKKPKRPAKELIWEYTDIPREPPELSTLTGCTLSSIYQATSTMLRDGYLVKDKQGAKAFYSRAPGASPPSSPPRTNSKGNGDARPSAPVRGSTRIKDRLDRAVTHLIDVLAEATPLMQEPEEMRKLNEELNELRAFKDNVDQATVALRKKKKRR